MIILLIILASLIGYLAIGTAVAVKCTPALVAANTYTFVRYRYPSIKEDPVWAHDPNGEHVKRGAIESKQAGIVIGWPFALPVNLIGGVLNKATDNADPNVAKALREKDEALQLELDQAAEKSNKEYERKLDNALRLAEKEHRLLASKIS